MCELLIVRDQVKNINKKLELKQLLSQLVKKRQHTKFFTHLHHTLVSLNTDRTEGKARYELETKLSLPVC